MEEIFAHIVSYVELGLNASAALVITMGGLQALYGTLRIGFRLDSLVEKRAVWSHFARWLILALEFELAADLLRTVVTPTWTDLGQLATIAGIRTFLSYFLERDVNKISAAAASASASK